jgi:hypothetical protein
MKLLCQPLQIHGQWVADQFFKSFAFFTTRRLCIFPVKWRTYFITYRSSVCTISFIVKYLNVFCFQPSLPTYPHVPRLVTCAVGLSHLAYIWRPILVTTHRSNSTAWGRCSPRFNEPSWLSREEIFHYHLIQLTYLIYLCMALTHSLTHGDQPFLRSRQFCSYSRTSQHFIEPESSLSCSQEPFTGPYPESDQFNSYHSILSL